MGIYIAAIGFGLVAAAVLAIAAVGFTMQFAVTDILNLAYGGVMIAAAFVAYAVNRLGVTIWLGVMAGAAAGAVLSVLLNRIVYAPFKRRRISN
ncbi:MAG: ABC transporter permease subunit, partial [Acidimicrobiales bacterium]